MSAPAAVWQVLPGMFGVRCRRGHDVLPPLYSTHLAAMQAAREHVAEHAATVRALGGGR